MLNIDLMTKVLIVNTLNYLKKHSKMPHNQQDIVVNTVSNYHKTPDHYVNLVNQETSVSDSNLTSMTEMTVSLNYNSVPISVGDLLGISTENSNSLTDLIFGGEETGITEMSE